MSRAHHVLRNAHDRWHAIRLTRRTAAALMPPPPRSFATFGDGSVIVPPARVEGTGLIHIADGVVIHEHAWIAAKALPGRPPPRLEFAAGARLNRFVKVVCTKSVQIGPGALLSDRVYVSDVEYVPGATGIAPDDRALTEARPVVIGRSVFVGVGAVIKPGVTIGDLAYVSAGSIVTEDVPPRTLVVGAPARQIRRWTDENDG